jgi:hypothetical protein
VLSSAVALAPETGSELAQAARHKLGSRASQLGAGALREAWVATQRAAERMDTELVRVLLVRTCAFAERDGLSTACVSAALDGVAAAARIDGAGVEVMEQELDSLMRAVERHAHDMWAPNVRTALQSAVTLRLHRRGGRYAGACSALTLAAGNLAARMNSKLLTQAMPALGELCRSDGDIGELPREQLHQVLRRVTQLAPRAAPDELAELLSALSHMRPGRVLGWWRTVLLTAVHGSAHALAPTALNKATAALGRLRIFVDEATHVALCAAFTAAAPRFDAEQARGAMYALAQLTTASGHSEPLHALMDSVHRHRQAMRGGGMCQSLHAYATALSAHAELAWAGDVLVLFESVAIAFARTSVMSVKSAEEVGPGLGLTCEQHVNHSYACIRTVRWVA